MQLSRAKHDTRLFTIVAPEPHQALDEVDLPEREPADAYDQLAAALARHGGQALAIDTPWRLDVRASSTGELRAERDRLRRLLDRAPPDQSRVLERAAARRQQAEQALAEADRAQASGSRRRRASRDAQAARVLAAQQAARALDAELAARRAQQQRDAWMEANPELGVAYRAVVAELAWRRRVRATAAEVDQPAYLTRALGRLPDSVRGRRAWRHAARLIEDYRDRYHVTDPDQPLGGTPPRDRDQRLAWRAAHNALERLQARQRQHPTDRQKNVATLPHDHDQHARSSGQRPVQGPERAAG